MKNLRELIVKGQSYTKVNDFKNAIKFFEKANIHYENNLEILLNLAGAYKSVGQFNKSIILYNKMIKIDPINTTAHRLISTLTNYKENSANLILMEKLILKQEIKNKSKIEICYALGKAYSDLENFNKSFNYYKSANDMKKKINNFSFSILAEHFDQIISVFDKLDFSKEKKKTFNQKPFFICGLPRSGTTLVEQIISAHKDVYSGGELQFIPQIINKFFVKNHELSSNKILKEVNNDKNNIANYYFSMFKFHKSSKSIVTDKMLQNFKWIGLLKIFFSNCKIIHCERNAKDNFLSIYKNNFNEITMNWTNEENDIILYYEYYLKIIKYWKEKLPKLIYDIKYENLVNNTNYEIKKLLNYCELKDDISCYEYYKHNKSPIQTASALQARKPIYNNSINSFEIS